MKRWAKYKEESENADKTVHECVDGVSMKVRKSGLMTLRVRTRSSMISSDEEAVASEKVLVGRRATPREVQGLCTGTSTSGWWQGVADSSCRDCSRRRSVRAASGHIVE